MQHDGAVRNFTGVFDNTSTVITDDGCGIQPGRRKPSEGSPKTISQPCHFWARKRATVGDRRLDVFQRYIQAEFRRNAHSFDHDRGTVAELKVSLYAVQQRRALTVNPCPE